MRQNVVSRVRESQESSSKTHTNPLRQCKLVGDGSSAAAMWCFVLVLRRSGAPPADARVSTRIVAHPNTPAHPLHLSPTGVGAALRQCR